MAVKFENAPINELVIATYFNPPLLNFRSEHVGLLWGHYREEFPISHQQPAVGGIDILGPTSGEILPMPRFWFVSEDDINLIQVQKNALMFNWRRRDDEYPHFNKDLKPRFDYYYAQFADFMKDELGADLQIDLCELTYINTFHPCEYWNGPDDTANIIPSFRRVSTGIDGAQDASFNCVYTYLVNDDVNLRVSIRNGHVTENPSVPALIFEIRASARLGQVRKSVADAWFDRAHEAIINCFVGMTNPDIQHKYWKPKEAKQ